MFGGENGIEPKDGQKTLKRFLLLTFSLPVSLVGSEKHKKKSRRLTYKKEDGG